MEAHEEEILLRRRRRKEMICTCRVSIIGNTTYLCTHSDSLCSLAIMMKFSTIFLEEVDEFFEGLDDKVVAKILFNIDKAQQTNDPKLFKKLTKEIWEMRTKYGNLHYRLFAFWDKRDNKNTLAVCTHGMVKKTDKVPTREIEKAENLMKMYFDTE
jgi:phage-related protein